MAGKAKTIAHTSKEETSTRDGKYLTFTLHNEEYGIAILEVKEIIGLMEITTIPKMPRFIKGVINLRGQIIPVVDLRLKFGMEAMEHDQRTCIVVVEVPGLKGRNAMGLLVDAVNDVANIHEEEVENTPSFGIELDTSFILGVAKSGDRVRMLLDISKVLADQELEQVVQAA
ncbi:chemotaxis protein CheW [Desulfocarbo indianensis]|nr:chemotaxis protein CheW [Desulfocarbo indianensis]